MLPAKESSDICLAIAANLEKEFPADATIQYEKARQLDPKAKNISRRLAVLYDRLGEEKKALAEYEEALKQAPKDTDLLNDLGFCHYNRGRWSEAEAQFRKALDVNPKYARASINLGMTLAQQGKYDEAYQAFLKVNRVAEARANVAFVMATQGKRDLAKKAYREALEAEPGLQSAQQALATLENGGKVNLPKGGPSASTSPTSARRTAGMTACAAEDCTTKEPVPDMSPLLIGPNREKKVEE